MTYPDFTHRSGSFNVTPEAQAERREQLRRYALGDRTVSGPATPVPHPLQFLTFGGRKWSEAHLNLGKPLPTESR